MSEEPVGRFGYEEAGDSLEQRQDGADDGEPAPFAVGRSVEAERRGAAQPDAADEGRLVQRAQASAHVRCRYLDWFISTAIRLRIAQTVGSGWVGGGGRREAGDYFLVLFAREED